MIKCLDLLNDGSRLSSLYLAVVGSPSRGKVDKPRESVAISTLFFLLIWLFVCGSSCNCQNGNAAYFAYLTVFGAYIGVFGVNEGNQIETAICQSCA